MTPDRCAELHLLIQADVDGELLPADAARVAAHVAACADCAEVQGQLLALTDQFRAATLYRPAPDALRAAVLRRLDATGEDLTPGRTGSWRAGLMAILRNPLRLAAPFGTGFALAAILLLVLLPPGRDDLTGAFVAGHIRALQPGHLMDVASTDQHTVKPWFDGRLDYAPPVKDLVAAGFPLAGGRLDYVANRPVAALVYQRRQHVIDLFVQPDDGTGRPVLEAADRNGYNVLRWTNGGMAFWAVSDLRAQELAEFVRAWQGA